MKEIQIRGACINNLKGFDINIPKNKIIAATGVSGSGKSSLVFDIIFDEGSKEYLQSLGMLSEFDDEKKFDDIKGIGPAIAVKQSIVRQSNPRSTVGSRTEMLRLLSLLYASEGMMECPECGTLVKPGQACSKCGNKEEPLDVGYFSYNNANGMCMKCSGRGAYYEVNMEELLVDEHITIRQIFRNMGITKGFEKVALQPGESQRVTIKLTKRALQYYDIKNKGWKADPGTFTIQIGASSRDIRLQKNFKLEKL